MISKLQRLLLIPINPVGPIIQGVGIFLWGLWVMSPFWDTFDSGTVYGNLSKLAPESFWGAIAFIIGFLTLKNAWRLKAEGIKNSALFAFYFWLVLALLYFASDTRSVHPIVNFHLAIYNAYVYLTTKINGCIKIEELD
jgi:hypothetical protein